MAKVQTKKTVGDLEEMRLLRISEVADILSCRETFVWDMVYRREIESVVIGKRSRRVPVTAVKALIQKGLIPTYGEDPFARIAARLKRGAVTRPKKKLGSEERQTPEAPQ